jgi:ATP-dependent DNA helicase RecG
VSVASTAPVVEPASRVFRRVVREARAWASAPTPERSSRLVAGARSASALVPHARRADWEKLLGGLERRIASGDDPRAHVEGLVRACLLFAQAAGREDGRGGMLEWDAPAGEVVGIGHAAARKLAAHGIHTVGDLLWTLPAGWDDLRAAVGVAEAIERAREARATLGTPPRQCVRGVVQRASWVPMRRTRAVRVVLSDVDGRAAVDAWWFYGASSLLTAARVGSPCLLLGRLAERPGKRPTMTHPELLADTEGARPVRARYPSLGVAAGLLRRATADAVARVDPLLDPVPRAVAEREGMGDVAPRLRTVHGVEANGEPGETLSEARRVLAERLAWVEAFTRVWQRLLAEARWGDARAPVVVRNEAIARRFAEALGFALTPAQERACAEIEQDLGSATPMRRLLLGDVGTGKTAVALAAAAQCVASGVQVALLVPTALLAEQYTRAAAPVAAALGFRVDRIVADMSAAERRAARAAVASGEVHVVVGTHALLGGPVTFRRLGLVVVDEQHRLGVAQRLALVQKGQGAHGARPHLLSLSATPIPRTMALALRGELATSVLDERPRGRSPVSTEVLARGAIDGVIGRVRDACRRGERVFFVCRRIEDDDGESLGVESRADHLARSLPELTLAVVHGAMRARDRDDAMSRFRRGEAQVIVGTTVIEVGIDVPEATLIVVDGAETFGLAQLHQLRGRVGRGERPGCCVLLYDEPLSPAARHRLETLAQATSGADVARLDLALRGGGDLGGTRQSGVAEDFEWLDLASPPAWLARIDEDARAILGRDPKLEAPEHRALAMAIRRQVIQMSVREEAG